MVDAGMPPAAALLAGTSNAARLLGLDAEIGTLSVGKSADIVAVPGEPIADIRVTERPLFVMRRGQIVRQDGQPLLRRQDRQSTRLNSSQSCAPRMPPSC